MAKSVDEKFMYYQKKIGTAACGQFGTGYTCGVLFFRDFGKLKKRLGAPKLNSFFRNVQPIREQNNLFNKIIT